MATFNTTQNGKTTTSNSATTRSLFLLSPISLKNPLHCALKNQWLFFYAISIFLCYLYPNQESNTNPFTQRFHHQNPFLNSRYCSLQSKERVPLHRLLKWIHHYLLKTNRINIKRMNFILILVLLSGPFVRICPWSSSKILIMTFIGNFLIWVCKFSSFGCEFMIFNWN